MNKKYLLGVTGSMSCGKSYTCKKLVELGKQEISHINTDLLGRDIVGINPSYSDVRNEIFREFGYDFQNVDGSVNRKELGNVLFQDRNALYIFNQIILPHTLDLLKNKINEVKYGLILVESALFGEHNFFNIVNYNMLLVYANSETQMKRLEHGDLPMEQIKGRIKSQFSNEEKLEKILKSQKEAGQGELFKFDTSNNPDITEYKILLENIDRRIRK